MLKTIKNKIRRLFKIKKPIEGITIGIEMKNCDKCKEDSIAHRLKEHFKQDCVSNKTLMKYDTKKKQLLISKKQFKHLIELCNSIEVKNDYDLKFVEEDFLK